MILNEKTVRTTEQALEYVTTCTLATISTMAMKKSRSQAEYIRQKKIAAFGINWMQQSHHAPSDPRVNDVIRAGGVDNWARQYEK